MTMEFFTQHFRACVFNRFRPQTETNAYIVLLIEIIGDVTLSATLSAYTYKQDAFGSVFKIPTPEGADMPK